VDASNLDRNLYLALQFKELGVPLVIALNMMDVAESRGILIDHQQLSALFGTPVVPTVARSNKGIGNLLDQAAEAAQTDSDWKPTIISYGMDIDQSLNEMEAIIVASNVFGRKYPPRWLALKSLEGDSQILELLRKAPDIGAQIDAICQKTHKHIMDTLEEEPEGIIADYRYGYIAGITKKVVKRRIESRLNFSDRLDKVLTNRVIGPLIMLLILYVMYEFTFSASEIPIRWLESFFEGVKGLVSTFIPPGNLHSLIVSGIVDGVGGVLGFVPLIMFMFFAIAVLEDSGYMARVAYMLDRVMRWFGLHGNSVMALIISGGISGGCAVPGVLATRTLRDPKERIATLLVVPFMNCGAKLPVFAMLIGAFFSRDRAQIMFMLTLLSWCFALFAAKLIRSTFLRGPKTPFVMELPPYRFPTLRGLLIHTWERTWHYIKKAGTVILGFSIVLWAAMTFPGPSKEQLKSMEENRVNLMTGFLATPEIGEWIQDGETLMELNGLYDSHQSALRHKDEVSLKRLSESPLVPLVNAAIDLENHTSEVEKMDERVLSAARAYLAFRNKMTALDLEENQTALKHTVAGWIGTGLERVTTPLGFDYRINIALLGGFAAKEIILSTLGTAYSLGKADLAVSSSLSDRLRQEPRWNPLLAFTLILFSMLYVPCLPTVISIRKETSGAWAGFSLLFNLTAAYLVALLVRQTGLAMGLGL
jgi:ferrous iron transport protein B